MAEIARAHSTLSDPAKQAVDVAHGILQAQPQVQAPIAAPTTPGIIASAQPIPTLGAPPAPVSATSVPMTPIPNARVEPMRVTPEPLARLGDNRRENLSDSGENAVPMSASAAPVSIPDQPDIEVPPDIASSMSGIAGLPRTTNGGLVSAVSGINPGTRPQTPEALAHAAEMNRLEGSKSGVDQIHNKFLRGLAKAGEIAESTFFPRAAMLTPGTGLHHNMLVNQQRGNVAQDEKQDQAAQTLAQEQAQTENLQSEVPLHEAQAAEAQAKVDNPTGVTKEWQEITGGAVDPEHPELGTQPAFYNKNNPKEGIVFGNAKAGTKPETVKEGELPLGADRVPQLNQMMESRYQVLHPGGKLPPQFTLPANATQKDYDRIDKAMEGSEKALGTKAQQDQANEMRRQTMTLAQQKEQRAESHDPAVEREYMAVRSDLNKQFEGAQSQIEKIQQAKAELAGGAVGQALGTIKTLSALAGGQGSGVRITQAELNSLIHARGIKGDFEGWLSGIEGKGKLAPEQLAQTNQILGDIEAKANEKQKIYSDTLDKLGTAKTKEEIRGIESGFRKSAMSAGGPVGNLPTIKNADDYGKLKKGDQYLDPNGVQRTKK